MNRLSWNREIIQKKAEETDSRFTPGGDSELTRQFHSDFDVWFSEWMRGMDLYFTDPKGNTDVNYLELQFDFERKVIDMFDDQLPLLYYGRRNAEKK